jgi:WD40 repeat protein
MSEPTKNIYHYKAFVSYSHDADGKLAPAIQSALQNFAKSWYKRKAFGVFRDKTSLSANPALWPSIARALDTSEYFLFLASPEAAQSVWVEKEIRYWLGDVQSRNERRNKLIIILTDGNLIWDDQKKDFNWEKTTAIPETLRGIFTEEPLYVDLRWAKSEEHLSLNHVKFRDNIADLAAPLHGVPKDEIAGEAVRQHRRTLRLAWSAVSVLLVLLVAVSVSAFFAIVNKQVAINNEKIAEEQRDRALISQSRFVTALSKQQTKTGNAVNGMLLAMEGLPDNRSNAERPYVPEVESALYESQYNQHELFCLADHKDVVWHAAFSQDGTRAAIASWDKTASVWDAMTGERISILNGHEGYVRNIAFNADGSRVATASNDTTARLWDVMSSKQIAIMQHDALVSKVSYSPDGNLILTASYDKTAKLWDASTGRLRTVFRGHSDSVKDAIFSPNGQLIATISDDLSARLWDIKTGKQISICLGHTSWINSLSFSPDGDQILTGSEDNTSRIWDTRTCKQLLILSDNNDSAGHGVDVAAFSPDGSCVVSSTYDVLKEPKEQLTHLYDSVTGNHIHTIQGQFVTFSPDGTRVLTTSESPILDLLDLDLSLEREDQDITVWDVNNGQKIATFNGHEGSVTYAAYNPEGTRLLTSSRDGTARIWSTKMEPGYIPLGGLDSFIRDIAYSPDGELVMARTATTIRIWNTTTGQPVTTVNVHDSEQEIASDAVYDRDSIQLEYIDEDIITSATFNKYGTHILTTSSDGSAYLWDIRSGLKVASFKADNVRTWGGIFLKDDNNIAIGSVDSTVRIWNVADQHIVSKFLGTDTNSLELALFNRDGTNVVLVMENSSVQVRDIQTQRVVFEIDTFGEQRIRTAAISFDGSRLALGFKDDSINVWNLASGKLISTYKGQDETVSSIEFSPDGEKILFVSNGKTVMILDVSSGRQTASLVGHTNRIKKVRLNRTGTRAISAGRDGSARMWDVETGQELAVFRHTTEVKRNFINSAVFNPNLAQVATAATNIVRLWRIFPSTQSLIEHVKSAVPRCLTHEQRKKFFLDSEPPKWCFDLSKWPYHSGPR